MVIFFPPPVHAWSRLPAPATAAVIAVAADFPAYHAPVVAAATATTVATGVAVTTAAAASVAAAVAAVDVATIRVVVAEIFICIRIGTAATAFLIAATAAFTNILPVLVATAVAVAVAVAPTVRIIAIASAIVSVIVVVVVIVRVGVIVERTPILLRGITIRVLIRRHIVANIATIHAAPTVSAAATACHVFPTATTAVVTAIPTTAHEPSFARTRARVRGIYAVTARV
jgi:hypothetical protein